MNKQNISSIPDDNKIEELLRKVRPVPGGNFDHLMRQTLQRIEDEENRVIANKSRLKFAIPLVVLLTITIFAVTPQGRAWAQDAARFFHRINSATIQLSDEQTRWMNEWMNGTNRQYDLPLIPVIIPAVSPDMAAIAGCDTPQKAQSYHCQIALAESKLGFDLKELPEQPHGWEFQSLFIDTDSQYAVMNYSLDFRYFGNNSTGFTSYSSLMFAQGPGDFSTSERIANPWEAVPADKVETVSIGAYTGEYVQGRFGLSPEDDKLTWDKTDRRQRLAWSDESRWYLLDFEPNLNIVGAMGKDQLIYLAESLVNSTVETNELLNPDHLLSISDAKKISRLNLKAPTLIPMDMDFSYARYLPDERQVQLVYGINEDLIINEWKGNPVEYKKPLGKYEYTCEVVNMHGDDALYCFFEGENLRSFLWWHSDGINYQMYYNDSFVSGGRIDQEKMLLIAESMQNIDDFQKKSPRTYEQVVLYEQALGMSIKKFTEVPPGWTYTNFWSDPQAKCIDLMYTTTAGNGTLHIDQCRTEYLLNLSSFPSREISRVKVGKAKGQYIAGGFVTTDDGKQVWDPTLPLKQLYWQEDGLWMQIALTGDAALQADRDALISLAESLH